MDINQKKSFDFKTWLKTDRKGLIIALFFILSAIVSVIFLYGSVDSLKNYKAISAPSFESIRSISKSLGVSPGTLKRELNVGLNSSGRVPVYKFGVSQSKLNFATKKEFVRNSLIDFKGALFFPLALFGLLSLLYVSKKYNPALKLKDKWSARRFYVPALIFAVVVGGFILGKSPNPTESIVKGIKFILGFHVAGFNPILLILFIAFSIFANKIICGWACPFGALQELIYTFSSRIKKYTLSFWLTNTIRIIILLLSLLMLFGWFGGSGAMIYHKINPFNIFIPYFKMFSIGLAIVVFLAASLFLYRPFCQLVCPFGLLTWLLEKISIFKVRIDPEKCIKCGKCFKSCPTGAIQNKIEGKALPADCFSCGRCLEECPFKAIGYK